MSGDVHDDYNNNVAEKSFQENTGINERQNLGSVELQFPECILPSPEI